MPPAALSPSESTDTARQLLSEAIILQATRRTRPDSAIPCSFEWRLVRICLCAGSHEAQPVTAIVRSVSLSSAVRLLPSGRGLPKATGTAAWNPLRVPSERGDDEPRCRYAVA